MFLHHVNGFDHKSQFSGSVLCRKATQRLRLSIINVCYEYFGELNGRITWGLCSLLDGHRESAAFQFLTRKDWRGGWIFKLNLFPEELWDWGTCGQRFIFFFNEAAVFSPEKRQIFSLLLNIKSFIVEYKVVTCIPTHTYIL